MKTPLSQFPRTPLAELPTPIVPLDRIAGRQHHDALFMKHDGISGPEYGGNKIRKLEFLLGEALAGQHKSVITYGAAGSNHALATSICCRRLGLKPVSILAPQESSDHVRQNILAGHAVGADLRPVEHFSQFPEVTCGVIEEYRKKDGMDPYIIPAGGTNTTGALGFVQAAFELLDQMKPDVIYLPMGTGGTLAGLLTGFRMAGVDIRIEAIRVVHPAFRNQAHILRLCRDLCRLLGCTEAVQDADIHIRDEFFGEDYGIPTREGAAAVDQFLAEENIQLENTYTGKTAAALLHDLQDGRLDGQRVLYWNTLNARPLSGLAAGIDFHALPTPFHACFESF